MKARRTLAALWGFAEATLFFVVPDVLLSWIALTDRREALRACLFALVGALAGGLLMFAWGAADPVASWQVVEQVPAIGTRMLVRVREELAEDGILAILLGPISGTPYKTYAIQASAANIDWLAFLLISAPARGLRFLLVTLLADLVSTHVFPRFGLGQRRRILAAVWLAFYAFYFQSMGW